MGGSGGACGWSWRYAPLRYDVKAAAATPLLGGAWCVAMVLVSGGGLRSFFRLEQCDAEKDLPVHKRAATAHRKVYQMAQFMQVSLDNPAIAMENNDINLQNSTIPEILQTTSAALTVALRPTLEVELLFLVAGKTPMLKMESVGEYPCWSTAVSLHELLLAAGVSELIAAMLSPWLHCCCSTQETKEVGSSSTEGKPTVATIAIARCRHLHHPACWYFSKATVGGATDGEGKWRYRCCGG
nr:hypothetical protein Iba_chr03cCG5280 [Ipomoea batatas]